MFENMSIVINSVNRCRSKVLVGDNKFYSKAVAKSANDGRVLLGDVGARVSFVKDDAVQFMHTVTKIN